MRSSQRMGRKRDPRELFHNFQPLIGCGYVLAASHYTMILKQNCVVFRYKRLKTLAELPSTRRSVWRQGNSPEIHYYFWKDRLVECTPRGRESSRTDKLPSHATINPLPYMRRPALQICLLSSFSTSSLPASLTIVRHLAIERSPSRRKILSASCFGPCT